MIADSSYRTKPGQDPRRDALALRLWKRWSLLMTGRELDFEKTPQHLRAPVYEMAEEAIDWHEEQIKKGL